MSNVSVIGLGKLGAPITVAFASKGHQLIGVDVNENVVAAMNERRAPVFEPGLQDLLERHGDRVRATESIEEAVTASDITFVVVATPSDPSGAFSLRFILPVCEEIGRVLRSKEGYHLVVITSTVLPGATEGEIRPLLEASSGKRAGFDFGLCYSPEFIALGSVIHDLLNPDFGLIGESDETAGDTLETFYRTVYENAAIIARMNPVNAEITKLAVNTFVTTKISFANMVAGVCERLPGADVDAVTGALGLDRRIGGRYLRGAAGYGGPCFPRDNLAFTYLAVTLGAPAELAVATDALNRDQVPHLVDLIKARLGPGGVVTILGLAYKPDTDVVEQSQGILLAEALREARVNVLAHDPAAAVNARRALSDLQLVEDAQEAVDRSDVVVVTTPWPQFSELKFGSGSDRKRMVIDCWRLVDKEALGDSVEYFALGIGE